MTINEMVGKFVEKKGQTKENVRIILECRAEIDRLAAEHNIEVRVTTDRMFQRIMSGDVDADYESVQTNRSALRTIQSQAGIEIGSPETWER